MTTARARLSPAAPHADYRRRARRIRSVFATAPAARIHALRELSQRHDRMRCDVVEPEPIPTLPRGAAGRFAQLVRDRMDGPVLRYSHRTRLIRAAEQSGIGRFEANLIIAAVQHQVGATRVPDWEAGASRGSWLPAIVGFCTTQCAIATGVWWVVG